MTENAAGKFVEQQHLPEKAFMSYLGSMLLAFRRFCRSSKHGGDHGETTSTHVSLSIPVSKLPRLTLIELLTRYGRSAEPFQTASSAKLLVNGQEAFPEMLAAIDSATASVDMETYTICADGVGARFQEALTRAARRGVCVRLIYDYIGSIGLPARFARELTDAGVWVAVYHPPILNRPIWAMNRRDHRKLLLVDQRVLFTGGLNIADSYASAKEHGDGWRDTHVRLDGAEVARVGERLFEIDWRNSIAYADTSTRTSVLKAEMRKRFLKLKSIRDIWSRSHDKPNVESGGGVTVQIIGNQEFFHRWRIQRAYLRAIKQARRYILIESAYFIPCRSIRRALAKAVSRGVCVAVAVPLHSDAPIAAYASRSLYGKLLSRGVRIFEWPHAMLHAKTVVIDDAWAVVGSYNLDHRSFFHQLEAVAVVYDHDFAHRLHDQTMADLAQCREVTLRDHESRSFRQRVLESAAYLLRYWL